MAIKSPKAGASESVLTHLVPEDKYDHEYIRRSIDGVQDVALLRYAGAAKNNVLIYGPTGPGKTSMVMAYCAHEGLPLATVQCHGAVDPATFWGGLVLNPTTGLYEWQDSEILSIIRHGGVVYLDEVNFLPPKVAATFHGLLDKRRQVTIMEKGNEVVRAHENCQVVASYNPEYEGTKPLNPAFKNRFAVKVRLDYEPKIEQELLCLPVMQEIAVRLRNSHRTGDLETPTATNMLIEFETLAIDLSLDFAVNNFLNAYGEDERQAVKEVLDLYADRLAEELGQAMSEA